MDPLSDLQDLFNRFFKLGTSFFFRKLIKKLVKYSFEVTI